MKSRIEPRALVIGVVVAAVAMTTLAQTGGSYDLSKSVVAGGGGASSGPSFTVEGTTGQPAAGKLLQNPPFSQVAGFWQATTNQPTAAPASISGKVSMTTGAPLGGVVLTLAGRFSGRTITDAYGNYSFENVGTDEFYVTSPSLTNYTFTPANRSFTLLANVTDAIFTAVADATPQGNPLDTPEFFVRQHYLDFLGREPDRGGLGYWSNQIAACPAGDQMCLTARRIATSDAFFFEPEFQETGALIYRMYKASFGVNPSFTQFQPDRAAVVGGVNLEQSKAAFANDFVGRNAFLQKYPRSQGASEFVEALLLTTAMNSGVDLTPQRDSLVSLYDGTDAGRAGIIRWVAEATSLIDAEYNRAFVLTQYFGYLRRDPDQVGYLFWLGQVNRLPLRNLAIQHAMVCSFITSNEYQRRFSPVVIHSNAECSPLETGH